MCTIICNAISVLPRLVITIDSRTYARLGFFGRKRGFFPGRLFVSVWIENNSRSKKKNRFARVVATLKYISLDFKSDGRPALLLP